MSTPPRASAARSPVEELLALCAELSSPGEVPEWVELIPAGPEIQGADGRVFELPDPNVVLSNFTRMIPFDTDHSTHSPGMHAPATGWIEKLEVRGGGSVWGKVDWTTRGKTHLVEKEYRFVSPVFRCMRFYDENDKYHVVIKSLASAALTNNPNLDMTALNAANGTPAPIREQELEGVESDMKNVSKLLGLPEAASEADVMAAVSKIQGDLNSLRAVQPTAETHVPRVQHDALQAELNAYREAAKVAEAAAFDAELNAILDEASRAGKMAPAARASYDELFRNSCKQLGNKVGLEKARQHLQVSPAVISTQPTTAPSTDSNGALTAEEREMCARTGITEASYAKVKLEEAKRFNR